MSKKQTVVLDSMNRNFENIFPTLTTFKWYLSDILSNPTPMGVMYTKNNLKYLSKIKMHNFVLPKSVFNFVNHFDNIRCVFPQLSNESFFTDNDKQGIFNSFHVEFEIKDKKNNKLILKPKNEIIFTPLLNNINEISVIFYDQSDLYKFDLDFGYYKVIFGNPTIFKLINQNTKHVNSLEPEIKGILSQNNTINTGSKIVLLTKINSTNIDLNRILNNKIGHNICKINLFDFFIPVDTSINVPYEQDKVLVYYLEKRFNIIMDIFYD